MSWCEPSRNVSSHFILLLLLALAAVCAIQECHFLSRCMLLCSELNGFLGKLEFAWYTEKLHSDVGVSGDEKILEDASAYCANTPVGTYVPKHVKSV